jgi:hypothetical protein
MRPSLAIAFGSLAMASALYADLLSTVTVNPFGPCGLPQTVTGTNSASATVCAYPQGGSASTSINFGITSDTLAAWAFNDGAGRSSISNSSSLFDYKFVVTGGSGSGFLTLNFVESGVSGDNDPQGSASFNVAASLNGVQYSDMRICGNLPAMQGIVCMNPTDPIGVAFAYGTPFELSVALNAVAAGGLANLIPFTSIKGEGMLSYSLPSQSDVITIVPEPSAALLLIAGMFALFIRIRATR